jgi:XapX domain-containing protein
MKPYLISLAAGLLMGLLYNLLNVRSPAPPAIALVGLLGMVLGEQALPVARQLLALALANWRVL